MAMNQNRDCDVVWEPVPIEATGSQLEYERFLPKALELPGPFVAPTVNLGSAYHNVVEGVTNVLKERERLAREIPVLNLDDVKSLPQLVLAVIHAAGLVDRNVPKSTLDRVACGRELRGKLLVAAEALVAAGLVSKHEVARIRKGTGFIDTAEDLVALAGLFNNHSRKIAGKTAVTSADIREAMELGTELRKTLRPKATRKAPLDADTARAIEHRDRLFALLSQRYDLVRRAGAWLFGLDEVGKLVPPLGSRARTTSRTTSVVEAKGESQ